MLLNIKNIETFQILERPAVKQDQDGHHLAPGHREFPVPFLGFRVRQRVFSNHVIKFFEKLVDNEINFCNFMVWNHSGIISVLFSLQRFKTTNFFAIFLLFIHFSYIELTLIITGVYIKNQITILESLWKMQIYMRCRWIILI